MRKYNIFLSYFLIGIVSAIPIQLFPLVFKYYGFDVGTVALLITIGFLAVVFQPIIGLITDKFTTKLMMIKILLIISAFSLIGMFYIQSLLIFSIFLIIASAGIKSLIPLMDGFVTKYSSKFLYPYSKMRAVFSVGFGSSAIFVLIFISIFNFKMDGILIVLAIMNLLCLLIIFTLEDFEKEHIIGQTNANIKQVKRNNYLNIILLVLYFLLYAGLVQINATYLALHLREFGYSYLFIAILNLSTLISQIYLIFHYDRLFKRFRHSTIMIMAAIIGIIQIFTYTIFIHNPFILLLITILAGSQFVIFPAEFFPGLNRAIKTSLLSTGFTITTTLQVLWVGLFNQLVIKNILEATGSTVVVYITISVVIVTGLIPITIYHFVNKNQ